MTGRLSTSLSKELAKDFVRKYMTSAEVEASVAPKIKEALNKAKISTQEQGSGTCHFDANATRNSVQEQLQAASGSKQKSAVKEFDGWTDHNTAELDKGNLATIHARDIATSDSQWHGSDHSVAVLSRSQSNPNNVVVFDPDKTHDPRVLQELSKGVTDPRLFLREMPIQQLKDARPKVVETLDNGPQVLKPVEQFQPKGPTMLDRFTSFFSQHPTDS